MSEAINVRRLAQIQAAIGRIMSDPALLDRNTHAVLTGLANSAGLTREELGLQLTAYVDWLEGDRKAPFAGPRKQAPAKEVVP